MAETQRGIDVGRAQALGRVALGDGRRLGLVILTALNFVNYIDRSVLFAVQPLVQREFPGSDAKFGLLTTAFFFCYMVTAPLTGWLADRYSRRWIMCAGALLWSAATLLTAVTHNFAELMLRHTLVGVGEATFVAIAPSFLSDLHPEYRRGRVLSVFYLAIPVGTALGYLLGGALAARWGWRAPFLVGAAPGALLGLLLPLVPEPERGAQDRLAVTRGARNLSGVVAQCGLLDRNPRHGDDDLCGGRDAGLDADVSLPHPGRAAGDGQSALWIDDPGGGDSGDHAGRLAGRPDGGPPPRRPLPALRHRHDAWRCPRCCWRSSTRERGCIRRSFWASFSCC